MSRTARATVQNLLTYSEQLDNAAWTKTNSSITANTDIDPYTGNQTLDTITASANSNAYVLQGFSGGNLSYPYSLSAVVKAGTEPKVGIGDGGAIQANFDLSNGTWISNVGAVLGYGIQPLGNSTYRIWVTGILQYKRALVYVGGNLDAANGKTIIVGDTQVVQANWPGPYAQAVAAAVNPTSNIRNVAQPTALVNKLVDGDMEATNAAPAATDLDMELADTSAWTAFQATLSKQAGARTGGTGSRILRVAANGAGFGYASQANGLINGRTYRITGWFRGDGVNAYPVLYGGGTQYATGTTSNTWQYFDVVATQTTNNSLNPYGAFPGSVGYVEYDDLTIVDVTPTAYTAAGSALIYKTTSAPHSGSQALRVARTAGSYSYAQQVILTVGKRYRMHGWYRGDGTAVPAIYAAGGTQLALGTSSTTWQFFTKEFVADATRLDLANISASGYVDYDDVVVTDLAVTPARQTIPTSINSLVDGDMEAADASAYTAYNSATLTKSTTTPKVGTKCLRVTYNGVSNPAALQNVLVIGKWYRATGWMRSDGTVQPSFIDATQNLFVGTTSTSWQSFDVRFRATSVGVYLYTNATSAGKYAEFDDIKIYPLSDVPSRMDTSIFPLVNILVDGNMEATNSSVSLVDGDMETAGVGSWPAAVGSSSKSAVTPHSGSQCLRVTASGNTAEAYQSAILQVGHVYRVQGWARGDGLAGTPSVILGGSGAILPIATSSNTWQQFDVTGLEVGADRNLYFYSTGLTLNTGYFEIDDVTITDVTAGAYTAGLSAVLSKRTTNPHSGSQCLRATYGGVNNPFAYQTILTMGKPYLVTGWCRSDGSATPYVYVGTASVTWSGTLSTDWQYFSIYALANGNGYLGLGSNGNLAGQYAEFDDVTVIDLTATPNRNTIV